MFSMIDFACRKFQMQEVIMCSLGLNKLDFAIVTTLLEAKEDMSINEIARKNNIDRTTAQKAIKRLFEKGLIERYQKNLERGGYLFVYRLIGKRALKDKIISIIESWHKSVMKELERW